MITELNEREVRAGQVARREGISAKNNPFPLLTEFGLSWLYGWRNEFAAERGFETWDNLLEAIESGEMTIQPSASSIQLEQ